MPSLQPFKRSLKKCLKSFKKALNRNSQRETDPLYRLLYLCMHDHEQALSLASLQTENAFAHQWKSLPSGNALLTDPWFKSNVSRILSEEELQIDRSWFANKEVLDAGCGNGRWSYGLAELGAHITAADINPIALEKTEESLRLFSVRKTFIHSPLEDLGKHLQAKQFDLVFSWGVVHHCGSFNKALDQLTQRVKEGGILYLYLYGRESLSFEDDLSLFRERVAYNSLLTDKDKLDFLLKKVEGDHDKLHIAHDIYAPLINRRLDFDCVKSFLEERGFHTIERTIHHTELFIRSFKGDVSSLNDMILPPKKSPYWFQRYA